MECGSSLAWQMTVTVRRGFISQHLSKACRSFRRADLSSPTPSFPRPSSPSCSSSLAQERANLPSSMFPRAPQQRESAQVAIALLLSSGTYKSLYTSSCIPMAPHLAARSFSSTSSRCAGRDAAIWRSSSEQSRSTETSCSPFTLLLSSSRSHLHVLDGSLESYTDHVLDERQRLLPSLH